MADRELPVCRQACHLRPRAGAIRSWRADQGSAIAGLARIHRCACPAEPRPGRGMRPVRELIPPPRPRRARAPRIIVREPDQGHGANRVAVRHGAQRHDPYGAREGQAQRNGNRGTRRQDAVPGPPGRGPRLTVPAAAAGTGNITSTGRGGCIATWPACTGCGGSQRAHIGTPRARIRSIVTARMSRVPER